MSSWHDYPFTASMLHLAPGERLSEVEFLKVLATDQWDTIGALLGRSPSQITNERNERLYGSVIGIELNFGAHHSVESLGEDVRIFVRNRISTFAHRFVEGLFVFDDEPIPDERLDKVETVKDLDSLDLPWATIANAFIARAGSNTSLKVFQPQGIEEAGGNVLTEEPFALGEQRRILATGVLDEFPDDGALRPLEPKDDRFLSYQIVPESDLNGAGLVFFARFVAMMNYGERLFLSECLPRPFSTPLIANLSTERRRIYFLGNASPEDRVDVAVTARFEPLERRERTARGVRYVTPLRFVFRIDLYRGSDKTLIASSLVRKALNVPASEKRILQEASRFLRAV